MVERGVARKLTEKEIKDYEGPVFYISHHEVLKPESKTTPCSIVFNSSANFRGHVLNEYYAKGPDMLNNLLGVSLRFREEAVAVIGDIQKMFHSIDIPLLDQMTHRFLWRNLDDQREPETYVITAVNMRDRPSGTIAIVALRKTAEISRDEFPRSSETILRNSYVDGIPESAYTREEALKITSEINQILERGGFRIKGWIMSGKSQEQEQGAQIQGHEDQHLVRVLTGASTDITELERVLGMGWNSSKDKAVLPSQTELLQEEAEGAYTTRPISGTNPGKHPGSINQENDSISGQWNIQPDGSGIPIYSACKDHALQTLGPGQEIGLG